MCDIPRASERLKPFYTPNPGEEILLIDGEEATLKQGDSEVEGKVKITQEWSPMGLYWEFTGNKFDGFGFGEVDIASESLRVKGRLSSMGTHRVAGYVQGEIEIGGDHKIDRVTFHLPNYIHLIGEEAFSASEMTSWSQIRLDFEDWKIIIQPCRKSLALNHIGRLNQSVVISGVGEIRKSNGTQFKKNKIPSLIEALRIFLSFAFAEWSPPILIVGSNDRHDKSWQLWRNYDVLPQSHLKGWLDGQHGQHLSEAFPRFMKLWAHEEFQEPLRLAVYWLIEASRQAGGVEGAIAFGQIPLEMMAYLVFVDNKTIVKSEEFRRLETASRLQLLLFYCGIPLEVPSKLTTLSKLSKIATKPEYKTGPSIVTKVRNSIIHPDETNRKILSDWKNKFDVDISEVRWETHQLLKWYITLILLSLIGYSGEYANRLTTHCPGEVEPVPWSNEVLRDIV